MKKIVFRKNGEASNSMNKAGAAYKTNYGVSLVHLREIVCSEEPNQDLAYRLWFRQIRETMIIATFLALPEKMNEDEMNEWGDMIWTIEMAEQVGRNMLAGKNVSEVIIENWLESGHFFKQYAAAMALGWRFRFLGEPEHISSHYILRQMKKLVDDPGLMRAVGFVLKSAGRFIQKHRNDVQKLAEKWVHSDDLLKRQIAEDVMFELEYLPTGR